MSYPVLKRTDTPKLPRDRRYTLHLNGEHVAALRALLGAVAGATPFREVLNEVFEILNVVAASPLEVLDAEACDPIHTKGDFPFWTYTKRCFREEDY